MAGWVKVAEVEVRPKGDNGKGGYDAKVRGFGGLNSTLVGAVQCNFAAHTFRLWLQDIGWQEIKWPSSLNLLDYDPFIHAGRLKIWATEWNDARTLHIIDSGYEFHP